MLIIFALIDGHFLITLELEIFDGEHRVCHPKQWAQVFVGKVFIFIDALKYSAIPFFILIFLSILIIKQVFRAESISAQLQNLRQTHHYRQYSSSSSSPNLATRSSSIPIHSSTVTNTRVGRRVTFMLLSVSIAFCIFSSPMSLMQIVQSISKPGYNETPLAIGKAIAELCQYINHSCNFFLYALTGRIFRREFVRLFFPTRFGGGNGVTAVRTGIHGRPSLVQQGLHLTSRHGSLYSIDNNRQSLYQTSRRLTTFYNTQTAIRQHNQAYTVKSPLLFDNNGSLKLNRHHFKTYDKSLISTVGNSNDHSTFYALWNMIGRRKDRRQTSDGPLLFIDVLKPINPKASAV